MKANLNMIYLGTKQFQANGKDLRVVRLMDIEDVEVVDCFVDELMGNKCRNIEQLSPVKVIINFTENKGKTYKNLLEIATTSSKSQTASG